MALSYALSHLLSQCGSLVGTGVSFPEKADNRRPSDCFWKTDPYVCSLLLLEEVPGVCYLPGCSQCVVGGGYGLGFSLVWLGCSG